MGVVIVMIFVCSLEGHADASFSYLLEVSVCASSEKNHVSPDVLGFELKG